MHNCDIIMTPMLVHQTPTLSQCFSNLFTSAFHAVTLTVPDSTRDGDGPTCWTRMVVSALIAMAQPSYYAISPHRNGSTSPSQFHRLSLNVLMSQCLNTCLNVSMCQPQYISLSTSAALSQPHWLSLTVSVSLSKSLSRCLSVSICQPQCLSVSVFQCVSLLLGGDPIPNWRRSA